MKRTMVFGIFVLTMAIIAAGCASGPDASRRVANDPDWVLEAQLNQPEDAFLGVGTATLGTENAARQAAENRARVSLAQQMISVVRNMIEDYTGASEMESATLQFFQTVSRTLSEARLTGSRPITRSYKVGSSFEAWTVMTLGTSQAQKEIISAVESARILAPHFDANFTAQESMDAALAARDRPVTVREDK